MVDCCSAPGLMPLEQAKEELLNNVPQVTDIETIDIEQADNRVLAKAVISPLNVPAHNNSAMDGYALCFDAEQADAQQSFELIGSAFAGSPFTGELKTGQAIRIMTGAVVPASANAVEMQENITAKEQTILLNQAVKQGNHIRLAGEDIAQNAEVFQQGHVINAVDIGLLASLGVAQVQVYRKLKVAVFSTGDELKLPGQALGLGDIYESNRFVLKALLHRLNVDVIDLGVIPDSLDAITQAFVTADKQADVVISSGGVSVGDADHTKTVLEQLGKIGFWKVAIKPGKPFAFGQLPHSIFFGLPGNPVSAVVTFHQLAVPALQHMMRITAKAELLLPAMTTEQIKKRPGRTDFQRGIANINQQGQLAVTPLSHQGSGVLSSLSQANCYIVLEQHSDKQLAGATVPVLLFDKLLS